MSRLTPFPLAPYAILALALPLPGCDGAVDDKVSDTSRACGDDKVLDSSLAEPVCVPAACGVGPWGGLAVGEGTIYVDAAAVEGGDGSATSPLRSIQEGIDAVTASDGDLVAIAGGTYVENVAMSDDQHGITLAGRCSDLVIVDGSAAEASSALQVIGYRRAPEITLQGMTATGSTEGGVWLERAVVTGSDLQIRDNQVHGLVVWTDAEVTLRGVTISGSLPNRAGNYGRGINLGGASELTLSTAVLQDNAEVGISLMDVGTSATLVDTQILDTAPDWMGAMGRGISVQDGATVHATRCTIAGNAEAGVVVIGAGAVVSLVDSDVTDTAAGLEVSGGVFVQEGGTATITGGTLARNAGSAVYVGGEGTSAVISGASLLDSLPAANGYAGEGLLVQDYAHVEVEGTLIDGNGEAGAAVHYGATLVLEDCTVSRTHPDLDPSGGMGIDVQSGASLVLRRSVVHANFGVGILAAGEGCTVTIEDTVISGTTLGAQQGATLGLVFQEGASGEVSGCSLLDNAGGGLGVLSLATATVRDSEVAGSSADENGYYGAGVTVGGGASLAFEGGSVHDSANAGIIVAGEGSSLTLTGTTVLDTLRDRGPSLGFGIGVQEDGVVTATGVTVSGTGGPGFLVMDGSLACDDCTLTDNAFAEAVLAGGVLEITNSRLGTALPDASLGGGFGVYANELFAASSLSFFDSEVDGQPYAAVWLDGPGAWDIEGNTLHGSPGVDTGAGYIHGNAVFAERGPTAWDGATGLNLVDNSFTGAAGIGVFLQGSSARMEGNAWSTNGLDIRQQACSGVVPLDVSELGATTVEICPASNVLYAYDLAFTSLYLELASTH